MPLSCLALRAQVFLVQALGSPRLSERLTFSKHLTRPDSQRRLQVLARLGYPPVKKIPIAASQRSQRSLTVLRPIGEAAEGRGEGTGTF